MVNANPPIDPAQVPPKATAAEAAEGEETVTMFFPTEVKLTLDDHSQIVFNSGNQQVPVKVADHPWLKANGVKKVASDSSSSPSSSSSQPSSSSSSSDEAAAAAAAPNDATGGTHAARKGK